VCWAHGGATKAARKWAEFSLWHTKIDRDFLRAFAEMHERMKDPEAVRARGTAVLAEIEASLPPRKRRRTSAA
jgi:hypothetical protein